MTDFDLLPGAIHRGLGFIARWPDIVLVIPNDPTHDLAVKELFDELGTSPEPATVERLVNELVNESTLKAAAYLLTATGGPLVMVYGNMEVLVDGDVFIGKTGLPVQEQIPTGERITIRAANLTKAAEPAPPFDLRRGIVPGGGITIGGTTTLTSTGISTPPPPEHSPRPVARDEAASPPVQPVRPAAPFESVLLVAKPGFARRDPLPIVRAATSQEPSAPAHASPDVPTAGEPAGGAPPIQQPPPNAPIAPASFDTVAAPVESLQVETGSEDSAVIVNGIMCSRSHFNNPAAAFCMVCGISMVHVTHNLVPGPRPTLGFVVFDDGSTFGLDRSYIVGREPGETGLGNTAPLAIQDNNETLSRRHAEIRLVDWVVHIVDLHSTNGTFIWDLNYQQWNPVNPDVPVPLKPGDTIALGRRTFVYESVSGT